MRSLRKTTGFLSLCCLALVVTGCEDPAGWQVDPLLATDTVDLVAPTAPETLRHLPTALDVVAQGGIIVGGRHPERVADAEEWDFVVRVRDGALVLVPAGALGMNNDPGITRALDGQTFEQVRSAPPRASFLTDSAVVMQPGSVHAVRSRQFVSFFGFCVQYAKLQPLEVDPEAGTLRLQLTTNENCGDTRLALPGS